MKLCQSLIASVILCLSCEEYSVAQALELTHRASVNQDTFRKTKHHKKQFKDHSQDEPIESTDVQEISDVDLNSRLEELEQIINKKPSEDEDSGMNNLKVNDGNFMDRVLENAAEQNKEDEEKHDATKEKEMIQLEKQERKRVEHEEQLRKDEKQKKKEVKQNKIKALKAKKKAQEEKIINSAKQDIVKEKMKLQGKTSLVQNDDSDRHEAENHKLKFYKDQEKEEESQNSESAEEQLVEDVQKKQQEMFEKNREEEIQRQQIQKQKKAIDEQHQNVQEHKKKKHHKKGKHHKKQLEKKSTNSVGDFGVETTKFDSNDKESEDFRKLFSMEETKKPVEVAPEQKVVEKVEKVSDIPVIGILEAPIEIPIESPVKSRAQSPDDKKGKSSLGNLFDQMMDSHDDLESYITQSSTPESSKQSLIQDTPPFQQFDNSIQASQVKSQKKTKKGKKKSKKVKKPIVENEIHLREQNVQKSVVHKKKKSHKKKHQQKHKKQNLAQELPPVSESGNVWEEAQQHSTEKPAQSVNEIQDDIESKIEANRLEIKQMAEKLMKEHQEQELIKQNQIDEAEQKFEKQPPVQNHENQKSEMSEKSLDVQSEKSVQHKRKEAPVSKPVVWEKTKTVPEKTKEPKFEKKSQNNSLVKAKPIAVKSEHKQKK